MLARFRILGGLIIVLSGLAGTGVAAASTSTNPPGTASPAPGPGLPVAPPLQSACDVAGPGEVSCGAVQLLTPSQYWHPGPFASAFGPGPGSGSGGGPTSAAPPSSGYFPVDLASAYGLTAPENAMAIGGATIAIVDAYDDPNAASDLAAYRSAMSGATDPNTGLLDTTIPPLCSSTVSTGCVSFTKVNQNGGTSYPAGNTGWAEEISLDLDMASAVCPHCNIVLVEASSSSFANLAAAVTEAKTFDPAVITNSYGGSESSSESADNSIYTAGAHTAVTVASGDSGYGVEYPAASPGVTATGGTTLTYSGTGSSLVWGAQSAWSDAGSGCSADEPMPSWQEVAGVYTQAGACSGRQVADVSADANPSTGVATYDSDGESGWLVFGGTSVSTQIIGAIYALAAAAGSGTYQPASSALYPDASGGTGPTPGLVPVTSGANGSCTAIYLCNAADSLSSGYNGPTGLGTPEGIGAFSTSSSGSSGSLSLSPASESLVAGVASGAITVTLSRASTSPVTVDLTTTSPSGQFSASTSGNSASLAIAAGSTSGTFTYEDTKAGSATISTTAAGYGSATLPVTVSAGPLATISVSPSSASLAAGASQTFTAAGADANGNPVAVSASWSATGGTVSLASGASTTFTAGSTAGSFAVTATASGLTASATVTVTASPAMKVTVTSGTARRTGRTYSVPLTVAATSSSGAAIRGASVTLEVYTGASCAGTAAFSGKGTTGPNGQVGFTFSTGTVGSWCASANVTASGYGPGSGETTFST